MGQSISKIGGNTLADIKFREKVKKIDSKVNSFDSQIKEKVNKGEGGVITNAMLSQEVREAITGGSVAVVGIDSVLESNIVDGEVTPRKTNFVKQINLFDKDKSTKNKMLTYPFDALESNDSFNTSDFIEVTPLGKYTLNIANYDTVFIYDSSKTLFNKISLDGWGIKTNTITMPENTKYIRLCYLNEYEDEIMFVEGEEVPNEYYSAKDIIIDGLIYKLKGEFVSNDNIFDNTITPNKTTFFKRINLFNKTESQIGVKLTYPSDILESDSSFNVSDFIEVTPLSNYTLNIANYDTVFIYDSSKTLIDKISLSGWGIKINTVAMPENAKYVRLSYLNEYDNEIMFVEGEEIPNEYCNYDDITLIDIKQNIFKKENPANKNLEGVYLFFGDSICYGAGSPGGYARKLGENNPKMTYINRGISGATVAKRTTKNDSVLEQVENSNDNPDYIILEGGVNDAWVSDVELGTYDVNSYQTNNLDVNTYSGALETLFNNVQNKWHDVPIFFIIPHNMDIANTKTYMDRAVELCQKWSIILIDLRKLSGLNVYNDYVKTTYTNNGDGVHPNELGYEKYYIKPIANILSQYKY